MASAANESGPSYVGILSDSSGGADGDSISASVRGTAQVTGTSAEDVRVNLTRPVGDDGATVAVLYPDADADGDVATTDDPALSRILASDVAALPAEADA